MLQNKKSSHFLVQVEAHVGLLALLDQPGQVAQVTHRGAVEGVELQVIQLLVAQRGVTGQHLRQDNDLQCIHTDNDSNSCHQ